MHDEQTHSHVLSYKTLVTVWAGLMFLTGLTIAVAQFDLGLFNVVVALSVASLKACLVVFVFMHLKYENRLLKGMVLLAFIILAICIGFTFFDIGPRT